MEKVDLEKRGIGDIKVMIEMQMYYLLFLDATVYWWTESESQPLYRQKICQLKVNEETKQRSILDLKGTIIYEGGKCVFDFVSCSRSSFDCDNSTCQN